MPHDCQPYRQQAALCCKHPPNWRPGVPEYQKSGRGDVGDDFGTHKETVLLAAGLPAPTMHRSPSGWRPGSSGSSSTRVVDIEGLGVCKI